MYENWENDPLAWFMFIVFSIGMFTVLSFLALGIWKFVELIL
jgi:hypothetical protein